MRSAIVAFAIVFIVFDFYSTFNHHLNYAIDGDLPTIVVPSEHYTPILENPFGIDVVSGQSEPYAGIDRYFMHITLSKYFKGVPKLLQHFMSPIESLYCASALLKILFQILFVLLMVAFIFERPYLSINNLLSIIVIIPLIQSAGYIDYMGIYSGSVTYAYNYGINLTMLLMLLYPLYRITYLQKEQAEGKYFFIILYILMVYLAFNGPLNSPILLIIFGITLGYNLVTSIINKQSFYEKIRLTFGNYGLFMIISIMVNGYAFYLGTYNTEGSLSSPSILDRYMLLPQGLVELFTLRIGLPLLLVILVINYFLIHKVEKYKSIKKLFVWSIVFSIVYLLLLPLGGFREYRPLIVRGDTFLPITILMILLYGISTYNLLNYFFAKHKWVYPIFVGVFCLVFVNADLKNVNENKCEKHNLGLISNAEISPVLIQSNCHTLSWVSIHHPNNSKIISRFLTMVGITESDIYFYQEK